MNILKRFLFVSLAGLLLTSFSLALGMTESPDWESELTGSDSNYENITFADKELDIFLKAKDYVFKRYWRKAKEQLEFYLKKYPSSQLKDEALYWLAQSLNRMSREEVNKDKVIALKEEAFQKLELLIGQYVESVWIDDAKMLRVEISGELALIGRTKYKNLLQHVYETEEKTETDLKLIALNSLIELEPEAAIPLLKDIIETDKDTQVRKKVVLLLGKTYTKGVITLLEDVSKNDPDREVREEASYWLKQVQMHAIPVNLNYYLFSAELADPAEFKRIPENRVNFYSLPRIKPGDEEKARKVINDLFNGKLSDITQQSGGRADAIIALFGTTIIHKVPGFLTHFLTEGVEKTYDHFSGKVHFKDLKTGKDYDVPFTADDKNETLLAMRHGNRVVLMFLQFESTLEPDLEVEDVDKEPIYSTHFENFMGSKVFSSRQSWGPNEIRGDLIDFGQAKAEIPDKKGKWVLKGYILGSQKERRFIARRAVLTDPKGKVVARADEIIVPVDNPSQYKATGIKDK